jgi:hypothetical protein
MVVKKWPIRAVTIDGIEKSFCTNRIVGQNNSNDSKLLTTSNHGSCTYICQQQQQ